MENTSRTKNVTINASVGFTIQIIKVLIEFLIRTVFIKVLGAEYLGISGLFTNILTVLSFAELGIGNAIIFSMYKEIANNNTEKIKSLMLLYKKAYIYIGFIVLFLGLLTTPFIPYIISGVPNIKESIFLIYVLYVFNTGLSYFFAYKKAIIVAYQKSYITEFCRLIAEVIKAVFQIVILLTTRNFILFLIIQIVCNFIDNILSYIIANNMFPYLKEKNIKPLNDSEKGKIFRNVRSLVMYKFGSIILNGTDNIIISKMLGIVSVGLLSNYNLLINTINTVTGGLLNGFTASVGNLNSNDNFEKQEKIYNLLLFLCVWIYGFCAIAFFVLSNDFIVLWIGDDYKLNMLVVFALVFHLYVNGVQFVGYTYRTTMGLFNNGKYCPIIAALINVVLSILLCLKYGLFGILLATSISRLITTGWYDTFLVYKLRFKKSPLKIYLKYIKYMISILFIGIITFVILKLITISGVLGFVIKTIITAILPNILFIILYLKTDEFELLVQGVKKILWKKKNVI